MVVVTIVGADVVTELLVVVAVLIILDETGTEMLLLLEAGGSGPHIPMFDADVGASVAVGVTITLFDACWIPVEVVVTVDAAKADVEAIVIRGGGTTFIGCGGCCS